MQNGSARIVWAEEIGAGGYDPGKFKEKVSKPLPAFAANELNDLVGRLDLMKDRFGAAAEPSPSGAICISNFGGAIERIASTGHHTVAEINCNGREGADRVSQLMNELSYHYLGKARVRDWFARD